MKNTFKSADARRDLFQRGIKSADDFLQSIKNIESDQVNNNTFVELQNSI
jgi:hypothetical protein